MHLYRACLCVHLRMYVSVCVRACVRAYVCVCGYVYTSASVYDYVICVYIYACMNLLAWEFTYVRVRLLARLLHTNSAVISCGVYINRDVILYHLFTQSNYAMLFICAIYTLIKTWLSVILSSVILLLIIPIS